MCCVFWLSSMAQRKRKRERPVRLRAYPVWCESSLTLNIHTVLQLKCLFIKHSTFPTVYSLHNDLSLLAAAAAAHQTKTRLCLVSSLHTCLTFPNLLFVLVLWIALVPFLNILILFSSGGSFHIEE